MNDLVKRLQYQAGAKDPDLHKYDVDLLWEAADRISELEEKLSPPTYPFCRDCDQRDIRIRELESRLAAVEKWYENHAGTLVVLPPRTVRELEATLQSADTQSCNQPK